jgi:TRAP-type C4-dicarboxylate transport system permease small subunit
LQQAINRLEDALLALVLIGMITLAASQILLRNLGVGGVAWGDPLLRVLVLWVALLGAMAATRDAHHIRIDLLTRFLPAPVQGPVRRLTDLFAALVCGLIAWHGARFVHMEYLAATALFDGVPAWVCEVIIPFGFGVMALRYLLRGFSAHPRDTEP